MAKLVDTSILEKRLGIHLLMYRATVINNMLKAEMWAESATGQTLPFLHAPNNAELHTPST